MQQVVVIHGGDAFETREEYLQSLHEKEITLERLRFKGWKGNLKEDLGPDYDVIAPKMPNAQNARYEEWKIIFDKIAPLLDNNAILIGHSLGGIFLVKYLSESNFPKKIKALILVAAPYNTADRHPLVDFTIEESFDRLLNQVKQIKIYHSRDDRVVDFKNAELYNKSLPGSEFKEFDTKGHFNDANFPELVEDIKKLS